MARKPVSLATKAKIAASLRGNKNAFRGGPKKRLSNREKVANINARTKANKLNLSDAQLRQRAAVAKRLRARARAEEAGIKPNHAKPIPTTTTIAKRNVEVKENVAIAKHKIAPVETKKAGGNSQSETESRARSKLTEAQTRLRVAKTNNGEGNFNKTQNKSLRSQVEVRADITALEKQLSVAKQRNARASASQIIGKLNKLDREMAQIRAAGQPSKADRSKSSTDPLTKRTSRPRSLPQGHKRTEELRSGDHIVFGGAITKLTSGGRLSTDPSGNAALTFSTKDGDLTITKRQSTRVYQPHEL